VATQENLGDLGLKKTIPGGGSKRGSYGGAKKIGMMLGSMKKKKAVTKELSKNTSF